MIYFQNNLICTVLLLGTANYKGDQLDLQFAAKDAEDFSNALYQTASALLGQDAVHIATLSTADTAALPFKDSIRNVFEFYSKKAEAKDILVIYFSGHGINYQNGGDSKFHYLTMEIESGELKDHAIRENYTISTDELTDWIKEIPVNKQVLIMDACASGKVIEDIMVAKKSISSTQVRAMERLKDRTGMFILTGSASDKVSYEASRFGQSLLTYTILEGMKGQALRGGEFVDILKLFQHALENVPLYAKFIGGITNACIGGPVWWK